MLADDDVTVCQTHIPAWVDEISEPKLAFVSQPGVFNTFTVFICICVDHKGLGVKLEPNLQDIAESALSTEKL